LNAFVDCEQIRGNRECCCAIRPSQKGRKPGSKIDCRGPQDAQRSRVVLPGQQNIDIPARHTSVEQPSASRLNDVSHTGSDDIQLISEEVGRDGVRATARMIRHLSILSQVASTAQDVDEIAIHTGNIATQNRRATCF
jgi:hypothetical protein